MQENKKLIEMLINSKDEIIKLQKKIIDAKLMKSTDPYLPIKTEDVYTADDLNISD